MKVIELHKVSELEIFSKWNSSIFNTPCHLNKWKKSCHLLSRVLWWKELEFTKIIKAKMKVWESPFIPSHLTFKSFKFTHFQSINQTINQNYLFVYNIPKFRILGCYKLPHLKWISSSRFEEASKKILGFWGCSSKTIGRKGQRCYHT